jgi:hypothetical protein
MSLDAKQDSMVSLFHVLSFECDWAYSHYLLCIESPTVDFDWFIISSCSRDFPQVRLTKWVVEHFCTCQSSVLESNEEAQQYTNFEKLCNTMKNLKGSDYHE